jgi:aspartate/glutamate racemase
MALVRGGRNTYGEAIGILVLDMHFPRIPGDIGNGTTWDFPVRYLRVENATSRRVVKEGDRRLIEPFCDAARELEKAGVRAITTSCGFLAQFQREMASAVHIPVFTSSLLLIPMVARMLNPGQKVGILTADAASLGEGHFQGAGWSSADIPVAVRGMQEHLEFRQPFTEDTETLDPGQVGQAIVTVAREMLQDHPDVGAIVLECTNMAPYAALVQDAVHLPVFDIQLLTNLMFEATHRKPYEGDL